MWRDQIDDPVLLEKKVRNRLMDLVMHWCPAIVAELDQ